MTLRRELTAMDDLELVGYVRGVPDKSEMTEALADRLRVVAQQRDRLAAELSKCREKVQALELGVALDKIAAYQDLLDKPPAVKGART